MTLSFFDADGKLISSKFFSLGPGQAASLDFNIVSQGGGGGTGRVAVRAEVTVEPNARGVVPCIMPTLEIIDVASGKTTGLLIGLL